MKIFLALISLTLVSCTRQGAAQAPAAPVPKEAPPVTPSTPKPPPPTPQSIDRLLELTGIEKLNDSVIHQLGLMSGNIVSRTFPGGKPGPEAAQLEESARKRLKAIVDEDLSWDKMRPVYAEIYSANFTQEDVDGVIAFYESKAQKDYAAKMPLVTKKTYGQIQQRIGLIMKKMQDTMKEVTAQVQALNKAAAPAAPAPVPAH